MTPSISILGLTLAVTANPARSGVEQGPEVEVAAPGLSIAAGPELRGVMPPSFSWGFHAGYQWRPVAGHMLAGVGFRFRHVPWNRRNQCTDGAVVCQSTHVFRFAPQARVGGGGRRIAGYFGIAPGLATGLALVRCQGTDTSCTAYGDLTPGFTLGLHAGVLGSPISGLLLGLEAGFTLDWLTATEDFFRDDTNALHVFDVHLLVGWGARRR